MRASAALVCWAWVQAVRAALSSGAAGLQAEVAGAQHAGQSGRGGVALPGQGDRLGGLLAHRQRRQIPLVPVTEAAASARPARPGTPSGRCRK